MGMALGAPTDVMPVLERPRDPALRPAVAARAHTA